MNKSHNTIQKGKANLALSAIEANRLKALDRYDISDTPAEQNFDRVVSMASTIFSGAHVLITFVDLDRVWIKADSRSPVASFLPRENSICSLAIQKSDITVFPDTHTVPALRNNPVIRGENGIRFYAAMPLTSHDGFNLGTICILDSQPREISDQQIQLLKELAAVVMDEMELRLAAKKALQIQSELLGMVVHNLKNPLSGILGLAQLLPDYRHDEAEMLEMSALIADTSEKMLDSLNELLHMSKLQGNEIKLQLETVDMVQLVRRVMQDNAVLARQKNQSLTFEEISPLDLDVDPKRMREIMDNLLSNCIKYTPFEGTIQVVMRVRDQWLRIEFIDNGQGLDAQEVNRVFQKFADISSEPTGNESSTGIGLSIVKTLVELHHGKVWAESGGKGLGSTFVVELPLLPE
ncbi:GAF domain-containing sensor histidine kinase [soil metagenome]